MIPSPPSTLEVVPAFYDTECYPNFWLLRFSPKGREAYSFRLYAGQAFSAQETKRIHSLFEAYLTVSFNGNNYDVPMITAAMMGYTCEQLKVLNDRIIVDKLKPWELGLPEWKPANHIDVMEVAPGAGGLKQYAARIHCKKIQDLPYDPTTFLTATQIQEVEHYCGNDIEVLSELFYALEPQIKQRESLSTRYGIDLRSKSDAQVAEAVIKHRCEKALGRRLYKPDIDWNMAFRYNPPSFLSFATPQLQNALEIVKHSVFRLGPAGSPIAPERLEQLSIPIGQSVYQMGIGGLHSQEKSVWYVSDATYVLRDIDVASYYPTLILNSGEYPEALGPIFRDVYREVKDERLLAKALQKRLEKEGFKGSVEWQDAEAGNEGGKIMINGTFGKTGSSFSILFAPTMLIQTTLTGQLSLLMLIEWHEHYGIQVISANTDGMVIKVRRDQIHISEQLIKAWEERTGLEMETAQYLGIYSRDVNNYFAVKAKWDDKNKCWLDEPGEVKRKGEYAKSGLIAKKNPDVEICSDAVADYLAHGTPIEYTIANCRDIRKFVTIQKVAGGGVKMWGEGPRKGQLVRDMVPMLQANGWIKDARKWRKGDYVTDAATAYQSLFAPQTPEYLGKVVRWYYSTEAPGPIVYATNGNTVSLSYGARPCMTLPDEFPSDIDYAWYIQKARSILVDIGK